MNYFTVNCKVSLRASSSVNHSSPQQAAGYSGSRIKNKGFTLVELLVVVAIIAILATISVTVFSGAQANARDGKRKSDVNSIAKTIEGYADRSVSPAAYLYDAAGLGNDFPKGLPDDPSPSSRHYCIQGASIPGTVPPSTPSASLLVSGFTGGCPQNFAPYNTNLPTLANKWGAWTLCTALEVGTTSTSTNFYCVKSLTK